MPKDKNGIKSMLEKHTNKKGEEGETWVIKFGSMFRGKRSTANRESDVKALAGVNSPPRRVKHPNEITVTRTGMLFRIKVLHCKVGKRKISKEWL